jgi:hypothetical protein
VILFRRFKMTMDRMDAVELDVALAPVTMVAVASPRASPFKNWLVKICWNAVLC